MSPNEQNLSLVDFLQAEKAGWEELESLVEMLSPEQAQIPGYLPGWSVKDFLAHLAGWLAEAGQVLEQIRPGTFTDGGVDVDARNDGFVDANREEPLSFVFFEVRAARRRLLHHLHGLTGVPPTAEDSLRKLATPDGTVLTSGVAKAHDSAKTDMGSPAIEWSAPAAKPG